MGSIIRFLLLTCLTFQVFASELSTSELSTSEQRAREIIAKMEQLYRGDSSDATITMKVETPHYQRTLTMTGQTQGKELAFFRILSPKSVVAFCG